MKVGPPEKVPNLQTAGTSQILRGVVLTPFPGSAKTLFGLI